MNIIWIPIAAFAGGVLNAFNGWLDSGEVFNIRKFAKSVIGSLFGAAIFVAGYTFSGSDIGIMDIVAAVLGGAGFDAGVNRLSGMIRRIG